MTGAGWCVDYDDESAIHAGTCDVYDRPGGRLIHTAAWLGVTCVAGDPCPDEPPPPPPPTECLDGPDGVTVDFFWSGKTAKNPTVILGQDQERGLWSASFYCGRKGAKIHDYDPGYPGGIPTFWDGHYELKDGDGLWRVRNGDGDIITAGHGHRGAALAEAVEHHGAQTSWLRQREFVDCGDDDGCNIDCTWSTSNGHNIGCEPNFRAKNTFAVKVWVNGRWLYGGCPPHMNVNSCREGVLVAR